MLNGVKLRTFGLLSDERVYANIGYAIAPDDKTKLLTIRFAHDGSVIGDWVPTWNDVSYLIRSALQTEWKNTEGRNEFTRTMKRKALLDLMLNPIIDHISLIQEASRGDAKKGFNILPHVKSIVELGLENDDLAAIESFSAYVAHSSKYVLGERRKEKP